MLEAAFKLMILLPRNMSKLLNERIELCVSVNFLNAFIFFVYLLCLGISLFTSPSKLMTAIIHTRDDTSDLIPKAALAATRLSISDTKRAMSRPIAISSSLKSRFDQMHRDKLDIDWFARERFLESIQSK